VRVLQPGGRPDLAQEPLGAEAAGERGEEDLEGDGAVVSEVTRQIDDGHAAAPELALEHIPIPQRVLEVVARLGGSHDDERDSRGGPRMGFKLPDRRDWRATLARLNVRHRQAWSTPIFTVPVAGRTPGYSSARRLPLFQRTLNPTSRNASPTSSGAAAIGVWCDLT
jgi:hypothetical protein